MDGRERSKMEEARQVVTKDMTVSEIIEKHPVAADIMQSYGLSCFGCSVNTMESLEMGAKSHGIPDERIDDMVREINEAVLPGKEEKNLQTPERETGELVVTEKAVEKMKSILKEQNKEGWGIRILVSSGGCAGYMYGMDFARKAQSGDKTLKFDGLKVFVDQASLRLLAGVKVDYVETLQESGFKFDNPNAKASCGCGKSFN
jgi:iron-sulfur cluster assembly accessory protein